jgi:hypothetical protein
MCKNFKVITSDSVTSYESIGDIFVEKQNKKEHVVPSELAKYIHDDAMNRASYVRMRKHEHEIIL